jgi:hypothetical protein
MATRRRFKGNTHTHTTYSDGDSPPEVVVDWYAEHGYDFLFLTDHNAVIPDDHLARLQRRGLAVWQGEEITMAAVHVNGLGLQRLITPAQPGRSAAESLVREGRSERIRWAVEQVRAQGGVATVNHPNYLWTLTADVLAEAGDFGLLEVANGHPGVANEGDDAHPSTEWTWDRLLGRGRRVWGVASDDAHHFQVWGEGWSNPGRGWLHVEAASPRIHDCLEALRAGRFYASSGLELDDYRVTRSEIAVELASKGARIELIGEGGRRLDAVEGQRASFALGGIGSPYVRLRASDAVGGRLWMQPVFI